MSDRQRDLFDTSPAPWELDDQRDGTIASVVFVQPPFGPFDYLVPTSLAERVRPGTRVRVPMGRGNRLLVGYCTDVRTGEARGRNLKEVRAAVDPHPLLSATMLKLTTWISRHYLCPLGPTIEAVVPAGVRQQAGTRATTFLSVPTNVAARLTQLKLPPKQARALRILAASPEPLTPAQLAAATGCAEGPVQALRKKGLVRESSQRVDRAASVEATVARQAPHPLNDDQRNALNRILDVVKSRRHATLLIHGVTGSGKTEVYIRAIDEVIRYQRQAIVLVPEISLTPQTRVRFQSRFARVAVLHSRMSDTERNRHWKRIAQGEVDVVVGARSAVFAPTPNLGLIVLDEEHDHSFKQETAPRYHARGVALRRAAMEEAALVLGSATPSLESYQRAVEGEYALLDMPRRVLDRPLPEVATIDLRGQFRGPGNRGAVSRPLQQAIAEALRDDGQVILLLNRRGYSTSIQCFACGHVVRCRHCDIALTHHRDGNKALCHYCDYETVPPDRCPECRFEGIRYGGLGTQRLEAEIQARFADVACLRMDTDTMQRPGSHEAALDRFRSGEIRILLGTQMIAKGLDFPDVTLVGVINADTALHFPDFRAAERTFQLVTQVAGRTGRGEKGGRVLVQTFSPEHPAIQAAIAHDFERFARGELPVRQQHRCPPFGSMVRLIIRGDSESGTERFADSVGQYLESEIANRKLDVGLLGPAPAPMTKLRGKFRYHALLLGPDVDALRELTESTMAALRPPEDVQWIADVDPIDML